MTRPAETEETDVCTLAEGVPVQAGSPTEGLTLDIELLSDLPISRASIPLLLDHLRRGAKPPSEWKCGLEFELFGYTAGLERLDAGQVQAVMMGLASSGDDPLFESGILTEARALSDIRVTVEPGGQIEFSGAPRNSLAAIEEDMRAYLARLHEIAGEHNFRFLATGFDPVRTLAEQHWFPKPRYAVMRPYLAQRGRRAWDMMCRTCAIQANLDYSSEEDLSRKFILGNRLAPIVTAMFACSPFENGTLSGYKSTRAAVWLETDADRSNISPLAFLDSFSLETFVDYTLVVPLIFARRNGHYLEDVAGIQFGTFLDDREHRMKPVFQDWTDHLTTIFTEARLKQYIELRSADCGRWEMALALQALWKGLMYDASSLDEALRLAPKLKRDEMHSLLEHVARDGLAARVAGVDVLHSAKEIVSLASEGLGRLAPEEVKYLDVLHEQVVEDEVCPADILLRNWHGSWHGSLDRAIEYLRIA